MRGSRRLRRPRLAWSLAIPKFQVSTRSEAIRRLVELGLTASQPLRRRSPKAASKAFDLAAQQIDKLIDPSTPNEERKTRKRRLLKGPTEFRDIRGDLAKPKS